MTTEIFLLNLLEGVKMLDKMAIFAYILKIVENDQFLRIQMRGKEDLKLILKLIDL